MNADEAIDAIEKLAASAERLETPCGPSGRMVWRRWGTGRPLILLHGGAGSWMHWIRNIEPLARTRAVWVPDMPGFGDSDLPAEDLDADTIAPYVAQAALALLQGRRFDLAGFSFGSLVAATIAADPPATLDRLVLVGTSALGLFRGPPALQPMRGITDPQERDKVLRFNLHVMMLHDPANIDALALAIQRHGVARERVRNRTLARSDFLLRTAPKWRCPVYGVWGRQDFAYRDQFDKLVAAVAGLHLRETAFIEDAGHWVQFERHEQFNRLIARWLDGDEQPGAG